MILGHCAPTWTGSFVSNLTYKNWDFSFNVYVSQGGTVYSPFMGEFTDYSQRGMNRIKMDFYIPEGAPILAEEVLSQLSKRLIMVNIHSQLMELMVKEEDHSG